MVSFKNRKREISKLKSMLSSDKFELGITYGRRRIGKTALHLQAISPKKTIYYLARKSNNVQKFKEKCLKTVPQIKIIAEDLEYLFEFLKDKVDCIIIDEFPNFLEEDKNFLNIFQVIVDEILFNTSITLFLLGSSISLMKSQILSTASPLYGRKTFSQKLSAMPFYHLFEFFPEKKIEELIEIYGFSDGIPYYLNRINGPFWDWLDKELHFPTFLRDEGEFLVRYEFINSGRYFSILEAISHGNTRLNKIAQYTHIKTTSLSSYLKNLEEVEFIKKEISITEKSSSKRGIYVLTDNFLQFWFRYIYSNMESLDQLLLNTEEIRKTYSHYIGSIFENIVKQFVIKFHHMYDLKKFTQIGRWWWQKEEIDLIALNPHIKYATLIEVKWQSGVNAKKIASELLRKEKTIRYRGEFKEKTHTFMIFAKSFLKKITEIGEYQVICVDLEEMEKFIIEELKKKD